MANTNTNKTVKVTKKERFAQLLAIAEVKKNEELVKFINHELELLEKKSGSKKQTETQKANEILMKDIVMALSTCEKAVTVSELMKHDMFKDTDYSNQKLSAMLKKLVDNKEVVKTVEKKKSYFSLATVGTETEVE